MPTLDPANAVTHRLTLLKIEHKRVFGVSFEEEITTKKVKGKTIYHAVLETKYSVLSFEGKHNLEHLALEMALVEAEKKAKSYPKPKEKPQNKTRKERKIRTSITDYFKRKVRNWKRA
ncbi:MAG: hypothetical protein WCO35_00095 [Candidatus Nomurabacteria bacterium]